MSFWLPADVSDGLQKGCKIIDGGMNSMVLLGYLEPEVSTSCEIRVEYLFV